MRRLTEGRHSRKVFALTMLGIFGTVALISALVLASTAGSVNAQSAQSYTVNGLTCSFAQGTPAYAINLVQKVVRSPQFGASTAGTPYILLYYGNWTDHVITTGQVTPGTTSPGNGTRGFETVGPATTIRLPDGTELGFATWGPNTSCSESGSSWTTWLDVQVPVQNGTYNFGAEQVHLTGGHK